MLEPVRRRVPVDENHQRSLGTFLKDHRLDLPVLSPDNDETSSSELKNGTGAIANSILDSDSNLVFRFGVSRIFRCDAKPLDPRSRRICPCMDPAVVRVQGSRSLFSDY